MRTDTATPSGRLTTDGNRVLLDSEEIAVCKNEEMASAIAHALDFAGVAYGRIPENAQGQLTKVLCW